jgi:WD repeat-containing protein 76
VVIYIVYHSQKEEKEQIEKEKEERLAEEERQREAKRPRHYNLDLIAITDGLEPKQRVQLYEMLHSVCNKSCPRRIGDYDSFVYDDDQGGKAEVKKLQEQLSKLKVVSRAKVTENRVYSAAYHPEVTKDLIFFGGNYFQDPTPNSQTPSFADKHGQLGIWDAQAPVDEVTDEDGDVAPSKNSEGGKYWRLQLHWPASAKSSISSIKFDPTDSHTVRFVHSIAHQYRECAFQVYTSSYDRTVRVLSLGSGISSEVFYVEEAIVCSIDLSPENHEMWISDASGGVTHLDLRQDKNKAKWYQLSTEKIGSVSVNPTRPQFLLTASNTRSLRRVSCVCQMFGIDCLYRYTGCGIHVNLHQRLTLASRRLIMIRLKSSANRSKVTACFVQTAVTINPYLPLIGILEEDLS